MRWWLTALVWLVMLGGTALFIWSRRPPETAVARALQASEQTVAVAIIATGELGAVVDPFAAEAGAAVPALTLTATGAEERVYRREFARLRAGERVVVDDLPPQVVGRNVLTLDTAEPAAPTALKIELLLDGNPAREQLLWLEPGQRGQARIDFRLQHQAGSHGHAHD